MGFNKGDKVICIDTKDAPGLVKGAQYVIRRDSFLVDDIEYVEVTDENEITLTARSHRFTELFHSIHSPLYVGFCWNKEGKGYALGLACNRETMVKRIENFKREDEENGDEWSYDIDAVNMY